MARHMGRRHLWPALAQYVCAASHNIGAFYNAGLKHVQLKSLGVADLTSLYADL